MATKQEFLDSIKRLEDRVASRKVSSAVAQAKITKLISEGKNREAYRVFEELPIMEQIALSITPGFGDALAVFETGEFKTRADERFAQDDTLGGIGNLALSGLAGLSVLPIVGPVAGAAGKVGRNLGRVAKVDSDMPAGGGSAPTRPNEYVGTRPVDLGEGIGFQPGTGLVSPNRLALENMDSKPLKLDTLVSQLRKAAPNKEGELRMLGLLDDKNQVTSLARKYFAGQEKVSPAALDQFLSFKQSTSLNVMRPSKSNFESPGYGDIDNASEVQRVYQVEGVNTKLTPSGKHYGDLGVENDIAFDSTDLVDGVLRVGRIQSDYDPLLKELRRKEGILNKKESIDMNPFELKDKQVRAETLSEQPGFEELEKLLEKLNESVDKNNIVSNKNLEGIFGADGLPIATPKPIRKLNKSEVEAQNYETLRQRDLLFDIGKKVNELEKSALGRAGKEFVVDGDNLGADIVGGRVDFVRNLVTDRLPKDIKKIADRELHYKNLNLDDYDRSGVLSTNLEDAYYGIAKTEDIRNYTNEPKINLKPHVDIPKTLQKLEDIFTEKQGIDLDYNRKFNLNKPKLDPYATVGAKSTKSYVLPVRNLINESLQNPRINTLKIEGLEPLIREGGVNDGVPSKLLQNYYKNAQKEAVKVVNEIADGSDLFVVKKFGDDIEIDLDQIRDYLKNTGKEAKISAFKSGGLANIDSLLNNL
jgi:hypothetical protein